MSSQNRQSSISDEVQDQQSGPVNDEQTATTSTPEESDRDPSAPESARLLKLSEQGMEKGFARDINAKIDSVEGQIQHLADSYSRSQKDLQRVMGDLRSQTAFTTAEIERIVRLLDKASATHSNQVKDLDQRLKSAVEELTGRLSGVDGQLLTHQGDIDLLKRELEDSKESLTAKIDELESRSRQQSEAHQALLEDVTALQGESHGQADQLSSLTDEVNDNQRTNRKHVRVLAGVGAVVALSLAGTLTYLELTPSAASVQLSERVDSVETRIGAAEAATTQSVENQERIAGQMGELDARLNAVDATAEQRQAAMSGSLEEVANKVAALEQSIYGPPDSGLPAEPVLTIHDAGWVSQRDPGHYSIQLLGAYRERSLVIYTNRHAGELGDQPLSSTLSEYQGRSWYNLFYGNFDSFDAALAALESLPPQLQNNGPWIRSMSAIQGSMQ